MAGQTRELPSLIEATCIVIKVVYSAAHRRAAALTGQTRELISTVRLGAYGMRPRCGLLNMLGSLYRSRCDAIGFA